jgi:ParG
MCVYLQSYSVRDRAREERLTMKETATCWIQKETHNRLKVFCALRGLSMVQAITQAVEEWLEQHGSHLGNEALEYLKPPY